MGNTFFWWAGLVFSIVVGILMLALWLEMLWAVVATVSWLRFSWAAARARGMASYPAILKLPGMLFMNWMTFLGHRKGSLVFREQNGVWNGVGDWTVYPVAALPGAQVEVEHPEASAS